jgi:uncharacterized membrane protein
MLRLSDSRNFSRTLAAICLVAGPLFLVAGSLVEPETGDEPAEYLADIAANDGEHLAAAFLFLIGGLVLLPGLLALAHLLRGRRVGLGQLGAWLLVIGTIGAIMFFPIGAFEYELVQDGVSAQDVAFQDRLEDSAAGAVIFLMFAVGVIFGAVITAVVAWRRALVPVWSAVLLAIAPFVGFFGESRVIGAIAFALLAVGLGMLGRRMLAMSDDEWARWELLPDRPRRDEPATAAAPPV